MLRKFDEELKKFDGSKLDANDALTLRLLAKSISDCLYGYQFRAWLLPISLLEGPQV